MPHLRAYEEIRNARTRPLPKQAPREASQQPVREEKREFPYIQVIGLLGILVILIALALSP